MKKQLLIATLFLLLVGACSLPPQRPVTRYELMKTNIYQKFIIEESPEQILHVLNKEGEIILEGKRNIRGKDLPVYVKLLATPGKLEVLEYDR